MVKGEPDKLNLFLAKMEDGEWLLETSDVGKKLEGGETTPEVKKMIAENKMMPTRRIQDVLADFKMTGALTPSSNQIHVLVVLPDQQQSGSSKKRQQHKRMRVDASCCAFLFARARNLAKLYDFKCAYGGDFPIMDDVFGAVESNDWEFRLEKGKQLTDVELPNYFTEEEWDALKILNENTYRRIYLIEYIYSCPHALPRGYISSAQPDKRYADILLDKTPLVLSSDSPDSESEYTGLIFCVRHCRDIPKRRSPEAHSLINMATSPVHSNGQTAILKHTKITLNTTFMTAPAMPSLNENLLQRDVFDYDFNRERIFLEIAAMRKVKEEDKVAAAASEKDDSDDELARQSAKLSLSSSMSSSGHQDGTPTKPRSTSEEDVAAAISASLREY
ncbi:hypothetical protein PF011_g21909 [Phytophthora fragariae]|uniref:Uncharacterized protein n=1 Tax=Phytophthora fragariae TaxID=53985 RepID=A0A6A3IM32_9STRA|nr:hypothetical protein PF011_g21909 [Phytophthora fragariae]